MRIVMFCHSLVSDWNHGNAHFLRGVATELKNAGHEVRFFEPADGWSRKNLVAEYGDLPIARFRAAFPGLRSATYDPASLDLDRALHGADVVIVHEWSDHDLVERIGWHRASRGGYRLFFHDTHHRSVTDEADMARYRLEHYDGVLAFGSVIRDLYLARGWAGRAWTWHEAADIRIFNPLPGRRREGDLIWIGNWGDGDRTEELEEFLVGPVRSLGIRARVHGVRYPRPALAVLAKAGIEYGGWIPNYEVPEAFARFRVTVHIPRRPYVEALPGIPTIRPFEAMACGIPLVCSPWHDAESLFTAGKDYLPARDGTEMKRCLKALLADRWLAKRLSLHGRRTILARHTCAHRAAQLLEIIASFESPRRRERAARRGEYTVLGSRRPWLKV